MIMGAVSDGVDKERTRGRRLNWGGVGMQRV